MSAAPISGSVPAVPLGGHGQRGWSVGGAIVFTLAVVGGAYLLGFAIAYVVLFARYGIATVLDPGFPIWRGGAAAVRYQAAVLMLVEVIQLALALALAGWGGRDRTRTLQLGWPRLRITQWLGLLLVLFLVKAAATVIASALSPSSAKDDLEPFQVLFREPLTRSMFFATVVLAGLVEELIFRGVLSRTLEETRLGFWGGALAANAAFAAVHVQYGLGGQFVVLVIGMTLSWMRARTGSIWPGAICHAANNALAFLAMRSMG